MKRGGGAAAISGALAPRALLLVALLSLLGGCLFDTTPKTPAPPTATATPRPTQTPTPGVLPIPQPSAPPSPTRAALATAVPPASAAPDIRAAGQILYLVAEGGRRNIGSVEANGSDGRRLVSGTFDTPVWSPDGSRFAAYGATVTGGQLDQLAIFTGEGRPLARYALDGVGVAAPDWSPDGRLLLVVQRNPAETSGARTAWVADDAGLRPLPLPEGAVPWRWMPDGRLACLRYPTGGLQRISQSNPLVVWSVGPTAGDARKEAEGVIVPLGWSPSGQTFYALDGVLPLGGEGGPRATGLVAIDRRSGATRTLVTAEAVALAGGGARGGAYWFGGGSVAPVGGQLALWLDGVGPPGTPAPGGQFRVALVDETGRLLAREAIDRNVPQFAWSAGGQFVAYVIGARNGSELHILAPNGQPPLVYKSANSDVGIDIPPSWSPDSRWVALAGPEGLLIAAAVGEPRMHTIVAGTGIARPAWRPAALR